MTERTMRNSNDVGQTKLDRLENHAAGIGCRLENHAAGIGLIVWTTRYFGYLVKLRSLLSTRGRSDRNS